MSGPKPCADSCVVSKVDPFARKRAAAMPAPAAKAARAGDDAPRRGTAWAYYDPSDAKFMPDNEFDAAREPVNSKMISDPELWHGDNECGYEKKKVRPEDVYVPWKAAVFTPAAPASTRGSTECTPNPLQRAAMQNLPAVPNPAAPNTPYPEKAEQQIRARIIDLYTKYRPHQVNLVDALLTKHQGKEKEVLGRVESLFAAEISGRMGDRVRVRDSDDDDMWRTGVIVGQDHGAWDKFGEDGVKESLPATMFGLTGRYRVHVDGEHEERARSWNQLVFADTARNSQAGAAAAAEEAPRWTYREERRKQKKDAARAAEAAAAAEGLKEEHCTGWAEA